MATESAPTTRSQARSHLWWARDHHLEHAVAGKLTYLAIENLRFIVGIFLEIVIFYNDVCLPDGNLPMPHLPDFTTWDHLGGGGHSKSYPENLLRAWASPIGFMVTACPHLCLGFIIYRLSHQVLIPLNHPLPMNMCCSNMQKRNHLNQSKSSMFLP